MKQMINRAINANNNKMIETKQSNTTHTDGTEIFHNNFVLLSNTLLKTTQGTGDPINTPLGNRIGDKINCRGVKIKMMVELNERYSDVTFRLFVVRCARGDTPTRDTLFTGLSGNKMLDTIQHERYTILFQKYFKIRAGNPGTVGSDAYGAIPAGVNQQYGNAAEQVMSRATKIVSVWIPGKAFSKSGVITYNNAIDLPKFYDYHVCLYAYSNYSTSQDIYYVGRVNDYVQTMYFKDA